jgi:hypothetical protein
MRYLLLTLFVASLAGCETKVCTLRGCSNQFSATVSRADGSFPNGVHQVDVTVDGVSLSCAFTFAGGTAPPTCSPDLMLTVAPAERCTETRTGNSVSLRCDPIPGQFVERISLQGTPGELRVVQTVDGVALLDEAMVPAYQAVYPNGPECGGACQQATASWTLQ